VDVSDYRPASIDPHEWERIGSFVQQATQTAQGWHDARYSTKDMLGAVAALTRWATEVACYPLDAATVFHRDTIAEYIERGCASMTSGSRATRRSMLLRVAEAVLAPDVRVSRLQPVHKDAPSAPYSEHEQRRLRSWAEGQTTPERRLDSRLILAMGLGAGLSSADILTVRADDITIDRLGVLVRVRGREVPVLATWEQAFVDAAAARDDLDWLVGIERGDSRNWVNHYIGKSHPEGTLRPKVARLRNTWIVHHLNTGTPLGPLACAAGLETFRTIEKLLPYVIEPSRDEVRRAMRRALRAV
jgi:integrase